MAELPSKVSAGNSVPKILYLVPLEGAMNKLGHCTLLLNKGQLNMGQLYFKPQLEDCS